VGRAVLVLILLAFSLATAAAGSGARTPNAPAGEPPVVASLTPRETEALWRKLVSRPAASKRTRAAAACRPLRAVFYAATDYLRLATTLAATPSPCAEYYISVPPLVADKTQPRPGAAARVRALGPNFHALAEVHFTTWNRWVANNGSDFYTAGVLQRQRMAAAGFDVTKGDSWAFNEASSAVRRGTGQARANLREFLRGLYTGDGTHPTKGAVFVIGVGQRSTDVSLYQTNLQNWFADSAFWTDMSTYVSDWSQEVYGDARSWGVAGVANDLRRDYLNDYLYHELTLAGVGPPTVQTASAFIQSAYSPLANAAWERQAGYGWTMIPAADMGAYVSAQVHALRYYSATRGQAQDHWGFAWAPRNGTGMSPDEFTRQSGGVLTRLAAAIRDSADTLEPANPGSGACGPPGQNLFCAADVPEARLTEAWKSFGAWTQSVLAFASQPQTIPAGQTSGPMSLSLVTSTGLSVTTPVPLTVTLSSSSPRGTFSASFAGPFTRTLPITIAAGTGTSPLFYYRDTRAGSAELTASAAGATSGVQTITVIAGPPVTVAVIPRSSSVRARTPQRFTATGVDSFGNRVPVSATWSVRPRTAGIVAPRTGPTVTLVTGRVLGRGTLTASASTPSGTVSGTASVTVTPGRLSIGSIQYRGKKRVLLVTARAVDASRRPVSGTTISILVRRNGARYFTGRGKTGPAGKTVYRVRLGRGGCFTAAVRKATAAGFAWDRRTPRNRFCT
jgi:hypothetical protein